MFYQIQINWHLTYLKSLYLDYFVLYVHQTSFWHYSRFNLSYHSCADGTQLYVTITKDRKSDVIGKIEKCVAEITILMTNNMLKMNDDKTELFVFVPRRQVDAYKGLNINIGNIPVQMSLKIRNFGVTNNVNAVSCELYF